MYSPVSCSPVSCCPVSCTVQSPLHMQWSYQGDVPKRRKEMFYVTTHSTHFIHGYMVLFNQFVHTYIPSCLWDGTYTTHTYHPACGMVHIPRHNVAAVDVLSLFAIQYYLIEKCLLEYISIYSVLFRSSVRGCSCDIGSSLDSGL